MSNLSGRSDAHDSLDSREFPYALVDVFAERPLEGNMLAIFTDARGLSDVRMQALARETNLAETTFIIPNDDAANEVSFGVRVRIFTTQEELPFAGHPTLGTASWLYLNHPTLKGSEEITLDLKGGPIRVRFRKPIAGERGVYATMQQHDPVFGVVHDPAEVSVVTGIPLADIDTQQPIQTVSTGLAFCVVPVRSVEALGRLEIPQAAAAAYLATKGAKFFYMVAPAGVSETGLPVFRGRMQFYNGEDPATGSAAGCAISWMVGNGRIPSGNLIELRQGEEIRRPSHLFAECSLTDGKVGSVFVSGRTVPVAKGVFSLE
jgi:trans-2,3-dihydro-3-hydroxyanthranilate isomerase